MKSILVVCIGNICRSPMAEGLFKSELPGLEISSAGVDALVGHGADPMACSLLMEKGIDISGHRAHQINQTMCQKADIIFVMDHEQRRSIEGRYPVTCGKVFRLAEAVGQDVPDPYRQDKTVFEDALNLIEVGVQSWVARINKITQKERQFT